MKMTTSRGWWYGVLVGLALLVAGCERPKTGAKYEGLVNESQSIQSFGRGGSGLPSEGEGLYPGDGSLRTAPMPGIAPALPRGGTQLAPLDRSAGK